MWRIDGIHYRDALLLFFFVSITHCVSSSLRDFGDILPMLAYPPQVIKKIMTGIHFVTFIAVGLLYVAEHEYLRHCCFIAATSFVLAYFIPPTGLIKPDDAPDYAKNSCGWVVNPEEVANRLKEEFEAKEKAKKAAGKKDSQKTK